MSSGIIAGYIRSRMPSKMASFDVGRTKRAATIEKMTSRSENSWRSCVAAMFAKTASMPSFSNKASSTSSGPNT